MKKTLILFLTLFSFVASGQSLIFGGSTNEASRTKLKGNASNYTINAPTDSTFYLVSTTKYTEIPLSNISSRSLTFTGSNGIAITGGTQTLASNRTWSTRIDSTSTPVITGLRMKGLSTGLVHSNSTGTLSSSTLVNSDVSSSANIDASKLGTGVVSNTEFNYLDSLTSQVSISIYNITELKTKIGRYNQKVTVLGYFTPNDGGGGQFYWNKTSTTTADDAMVVQVTGVTTGRWIRIVQDDYYVEWFGAKGDGATNDYAAITNCINYVASLTKGGRIKFLAKTYLTAPFYIKKNVSMIGSDRNLAAGAESTLNGTTIKNYSSTFSTNFVELYPDITISNISFDASNMSNYAFNITEAWGFTIDKCKFYRGKLYSLNITDCNKFYLTNNSIKGFLGISNADYIIYGNDIVGGLNTPATYFDRVGNGTLGNNKIYLGGSTTPSIKFNISSLTSGVFKVSPFNYLTSAPTYVSNSGTSNFTESTQNLSLVSVNGGYLSTYSSLTYAVLESGITYKLTGTVRLSGVSTSRSVTFSDNDSTTTYGTITANSSIQNINISFTPSSNISNTILKIRTSAVSISGTDSLIFSNLKITSTTSRHDGVPVVFNYPSTVSNNFKIYFPHSESYYPKFLTDTTMVLYNNLYNYTNVPSGYVNTTETFSNGVIQVPSAVMLLTGKNSNTGTYINNKFEDVVWDGIVVRGGYNNVFSGNTVSKSINLYISKLFTLEKGANNNTITGNSISARTENLNDISYIGMYIDEFSGNNVISGNEITNSNYLDIQDNYAGEETSQNKYDKQSFKELFVYQAKASDYQYKGKGFTFEKSRTVGITNSSLLISNQSEFSLHFENVKISNVTSDVTLFQQKDITIGSQTGRFAIRISAAGALYCLVESTAFISTSTSVIAANTYYNIDIVKDVTNTWKIYLNGVLNVSGGGSGTAIATSVGTKSYVGAGDISQGSTLFMSKFQFFNEELTEQEIVNLNFQNNINNAIYSNLKSEQSDSTAFFSTISNGSVSVSSGTGVDSGRSLSVSSSSNNSFLINVLGNTAGIKGKVMRISGYIKSSAITSMQILRNNKAKYVPVTTSYTKFVKYISPDWSNGYFDQPVLKFGELSYSIYTKDFTTKAGIIYLDNVKVSTGYYPCTSLLDFSEDAINNTFTSKISNTDVYSVISNQITIPKSTISTNDENILSLTKSAGTSNDNRFDLNIGTTQGAATASLNLVANTTAADIGLRGATSGNNQFILKSTGYVGIGTVSPQKLFHILSADANTIRIERTSKGYHDITISNLMTNSVEDLLLDAGTSSGGFLFRSKNSGGTMINALGIDRDGTVSLGTLSPSSKAVLDVTSTTKGVLFPRMTTTQKNAISSPTEGLIVYDSTLHKLCIYTGSVWETITSL
jgi:hypothetical protein